MSLHAKPSCTVGMVLRWLKVRPAPACIDHRTSAEFTGCCRDTKRSVTINPLHGDFLKGIYTRFLGRIPERKIEIVTGNADCRRVHWHANRVSVEKEPRLRQGQRALE